MIIIVCKNKVYNTLNITEVHETPFPPSCIPVIVSMLLLAAVIPLTLLLLAILPSLNITTQNPIGPC